MFGRRHTPAIPLCQWLWTSGIPKSSNTSSNGGRTSDLRGHPLERLGWAANEPWFSTVAKELESATQDTETPNGFEPLDVLKVERIFLHHFSLPPPVVRLLLDYARYWIRKTAVVRYSEPLTVDMTSPQIPLIKIRVPGRETSSVREVVFTTCSHDQGESSSTDICAFYARID